MLPNFSLETSYVVKIGIGKSFSFHNSIVKFEIIISRTFKSRSSYVQ